MFELKDKVQICLTPPERSKLVREFEDIFCKIDSTTSITGYSLIEIEKLYPNIAELFKLLEKL